MPRNAVGLIKKAEEELLIYFRDATAGSQTEGYIAEFPNVIERKTGLRHWYVALNQPADMTQIPKGSRPVRFLYCGGILHGLFSERDVALGFIERLLNNTPTNNDDSGLPSFNRISFPQSWSLERELVDLEPLTDGQISGKVRVWALDWPFAAVVDVPEAGAA